MRLHHKPLLHQCLSQFPLNFLSMLCLLSAACLSALCVLPCSQSLGLHCISASVEVGNMLFSASKALLAALATIAAISTQRKAALAGHVGGHFKSKESRSKAVTSSVFDKIVATLPDQVCTQDQAQQASLCKLSVLCCACSAAARSFTCCS